MSKSKKIAKNSLMLYMRMMFSMIVSLYTSRIVLDILGVEDYGIYNVVGGIVTVFMFLNASMSGATQRFLSFELGTGNFVRLNNIFNSALTVHIILGVTIVVLGETVGLYFLYNYLVIPAERVDAAVMVLHFSLLATFLRILQVPFNAALISNEKMDVYAYLSVGDTLLKLLFVFLLGYITADKLVLYSMLTFIGTIIFVSMVVIYCKRKFPECSYKLVKDRILYKELISYSGWNLFGSLSAVAKFQGVNILLNIFFGPSVNAARAVSYQVSGSVESFAKNFQLAVNPQIIKSYASQDIPYMMRLVFTSSRLTFYLLFLLALPILFETHFVLQLWLKEVPDFTVIFTFLIIINALIDSLSGPLMTTANATGKIKWYQVVVGSTLIANLPVSYAFLAFDFPPETTIYVSIFLSIMALNLRLFMLKKLMNFKIELFYSEVVKKIIFIIPLSVILPYIAYHFMEEGFFRFICVTIISSISILTFTYFIGINEREKVFLTDKLKTILKIKS